MKTFNKRTHYPFEDQEKRPSKLDLYQSLIDDHAEIHSLMGHPAEEFDPGIALDYHEDFYHPGGPSRIHTDEEIKSVIRELFLNSKKLDVRDIVIDVQNGKVKLSGTVPSQTQRDYALTVVGLVHGVEELRSDLIVKLNPGILPTDVGRNPG